MSNESVMAIVEASNNMVRTVAAHYDGRIATVEERLADAMKFVPAPETMCGYMDPSAPDEVKELIKTAAKLHGRVLADEGEQFSE